ncbi:uncharacterized protein HI_0077 isoform X1 [Capsicum annuum]|uniref:uncharacterized protein HI_0077 isoform X1 n=1 Tax=Capsicum annuum TaxID=4072 RepID=UPI001FB056F9|nr:uncharacterized protein HI_0077 isoform X1 [Capsicum annuum]
MSCIKFGLILKSSLCSFQLPQRTISTLKNSIHYPELPNQWTGLHNWRHTSLNHDRFWGPNGPDIVPLSAKSIQESTLFDSIYSASSLAEMGAVVLCTSDPLMKSKLTHLGYCRWRQEGLPVGNYVPPVRPARPENPQLVASRGSSCWVCSEPLVRPARPEKPELVPSKEIPSPKHSGLSLNAYMLHNLAHVELNAIDLAWDTVVRFSPYSDLLGDGFFADFAHVADDESRHFAWCSQRLSELGVRYGDMPAHNLLWRECEKSSDNVAARLASIPLVQEARGLDAGPRLVQKLIGFGDHRTSNIVSRIADEEVAHVAVGVYWFISVCEKLGCTPCTTFRDLLEEYNVELKGPFNHLARHEAGLPREWYDPSSSVEDKQKKLSQVYDRLECIIAMEKENSSLDSPHQ